MDRSSNGKFLSIRLNAAFTNESYAIRNEEEARLLNFAKGYDRVEGVEKLKTVKLRFPKNNLALNKTIVQVLKVLGQEMKNYQTPKAKDGTAKPGLVLKEKRENKFKGEITMSWKNVLKQKKISPKQKKIAEAAEPKHKITGADFKALAEEDKKTVTRKDNRKKGRGAFTDRD